MLFGALFAGTLKRMLKRMLESIFTWNLRGEEDTQDTCPPRPYVAFTDSADST